MTDIALRILLQAQNTASRVISQVGGDLLSMGGIMGGVVTVGLGVAAVIGAIGVASVTTAADFQQAMLQNEAHAGLAANQVQRVTDALLQMGPVVGQMPTQLAEALYPILSGFSSITDQSAKTTVSLEELKLASESVAGSTTSVEVVAKAATSAFNAYNMGSNNTAQNVRNLHNLFDIMNQTVSEGNMKWADYSRMIGNFMAKASQAHVPITEANAALAVFTNTGESAQLAGTHLGSLFLYLSTQSAKMADNAKKLHLSFDAQKFASMDLADKLKYLQSVTGGNFAEVQKLMGGNKTLASTFQKLHDHLSDYQHALSDLNNASKGKGATQSAFDINKQGFNFQLQQMKAAAGSLSIEIGNTLLPALQSTAARIMPLITAFMNWVVKSGILRTIIKDVGLGVQVLGAIFQWLWPYILQAAQAVMKFGQELWVRLKPIVMAVGGFLKDHMSQIVGVFKGAWTMIVGIIKIAWAIVSGIFKIALDLISGNWKQAWTDLKDMFSGIWDGIKTLFSGALTYLQNLWHIIWDAIWAFIQNRLLSIQNFFSLIFGGIGKGFSAFGTLVHGIWDGIVSGIKDAINWIIDAINGFIGGIDSIGIDIGPIHVHPNIPKIPHLITGGYIESGGLAMVHAGERVLPARVNQSGGGGGALHVELHIHAGLMTDRRQMQQLGEIAAKAIADKWRGQANVQVATSGSVRS